MRLSFSVPFIIRSAAFLTLAAVVHGKEPVDFGRDILPILSNNCLHCHGPDENERKGRLRLDTHEGALGAGKSGENAVVPGDLASSELILRVTSTYEDEVMPPHDAKEKLSATQIDLLKRWVEEGAKWGNHWAYQRPAPPSVPTVRGPAVEDVQPIDAFVRARLDRERIAPAPEADRRTLARRLSFDLVGLPPTADSVRAFVEDRRPDAYERYVDGLLASPHFGERWARHWLDLARYADSAGYLNDTPRPYAYLFRDWVINAINQDMPFDQFTIEQLAGDLLPNATLEQKIATGFHRNSLKNDEAGADKEEDRTKIAVDRTAVTGAVWLGLSVGCAECHTHKYDQITHQEFFQLYAFFNNTTDKELPAPQSAELADYVAKMSSWEKKHHALEEPLAAYLPSLLPDRLSEWEKATSFPTARWTVLKPKGVTFFTEDDETELTPAADHSIASRPGDPLKSRFVVEAQVTMKGVTAFRIEALADPGKFVGQSRRGDFALSEFSVMMQVAQGPQEKLPLASARADFASKTGSALEAIDGNLNTGWSVGPQVNESHTIVFDLKTPQDFPEGTRLFFEVVHYATGLFSRFRLSATTHLKPEATTLSDSILAILDLPSERRTQDQQLQLARHFAATADVEGKKLTQAISEHDGKKPAYPKTKAAVLTAEPRSTRIHVRGDFRNLGDSVEPNTLAVLHPFKPRTEKPDRLDLARWIVDPANPLTARVTVNYIWKHLFGRGIVATVEDYGTRGEPPSHPELLDYLATTFVRDGWSRKKLIREIVLSATYRQSSVPRPELMDRDPFNTLLARQNRVRLEAEVVRDAFLSSSDLLNRQVGGPSIYPPLPGFVTAVGRDKDWPATETDERYKRGLYIHLRRNIPYPMLLTFDAPDSSAACFQRERSNTPLQALTLLNDPVFYECSQKLGETLFAKGKDRESQIREGFESCMSREPSAAELKALISLYDDQLALAQGDNRAAMVATARVIMNLDEFITRE